MGFNVSGPPWVVSLDSWQTAAQALVSKYGVLTSAVDIAGSRTVTGTTSETSVFQVAVPGTLIGPAGSLRVSMLFTNISNANVKTTRLKLGGTTLVAATPTTNITHNAIVQIQNMGVENSQELSNSLITSVGDVAGATATSAVNTAVDQTLEITMQLAVGTDTTSLRRVLVEYFKG